MDVKDPLSSFTLPDYIMPPNENDMCLSAFKK